MTPAYFALAFFLSGFTLASADGVSSSDIPHFYEIKPENHCLNGEGASPRAEGTLYRGGHPGIDGLEYLNQLGIRSIVNFEGGSAPEQEIQDLKNMHSSIQEFLHPMPKFGVIKSHGVADNDAMIAAVAELKKSSQFPEFVHCTHGQDRTGMVVALHRVFNECWTPAQAAAEWQVIQEIFGNVIQDKMHDYFEEVTSSPSLSNYYREKLSQIQ